MIYHIYSKKVFWDYLQNPIGQKTKSYTLYLKTQKYMFSPQIKLTRLFFEVSSQIPVGFFFKQSWNHINVSQKT